MDRMSKTIDGQNIGAILFDLGNVLIDVDFYRCARLWSDHAGIPAHVLASRFRIDDAYKAFECGKLDAPAFYEALRGQLEISLPDDTMREGWNAIIRDEKPGIRDGLEQLARRYPLYVLTNTNPEHENIWAEKHRDLLSHFKEIFVSSHMGCRKPDAAAYLHVSRSIGTPCSEILFFDDAEENVQGARKVGMQAIRVDQDDTIAQCIHPILAKPRK